MVLRSEFSGIGVRWQSYLGRRVRAVDSINRIGFGRLRMRKGSTHLFEA